MSAFTPSRRRGFEILDDPAVDPAVRRQALADVARSNRLLGGLRAPMFELRALLAELGDRATLLDVGTGHADIPECGASIARGFGVSLTTIGIDAAPSLLAANRGCITHGVCADARHLPLADRSVDVVICSQLLHHFELRDAERVVAELNRVARHAVIVSDLRRSWLAAAGFWLLAFPLGFHAVTRHDGVVSVMRGFTPAELAGVVAASVGATPRVTRHLGYRITARWKPVAQPGIRGSDAQWI